jgi:PAS domain S-box-containing protein
MQNSLIGIVVQIAGHISDRLAEDALRESQLKIKGILSNLPGMVYKCAFNEERRMEFVSEGSEALTGYTPEDLVEKQNPTYTSLIHPDDRLRMTEVIERAVARKVQFRLTYRIFTDSMKFRWVWEQGAGVYNTDGEVIGLEGFITDITRQKVLDDQVKVSQARLNMLFSNMNAGCAIFHEGEGENRFTLIDMNNAAEEIEGKRKEDLIGKPFQDFFPEPSTSLLISALTDLVSSGKAQTLTRVPFDTADGRRWRDIFMTRSHLGHNREIFLISSDVTDQVHDEEQIIGSLHEKELLLKEVHHRVKNNLQIISGILKLQAMRTTDPVANEILLDCRNQVFAMASIHELLYSSPDISKIHVLEYVSNIVNHLKQEYIGVSTQIEYIIDVQEGIILDIERCIPCGLILNELITNAVKYAFEPEGMGVIRVSFSYQNNIYQMIVADNGRGMPTETSEKTTSLGTELVTRLTHQLRGVISIVSNEGTTISIKFPDEDKGKILK